MKPIHALTLIAMSAALVACATTSSSPAAKAAAKLEARSASQVAGNVTFAQQGDKLMVKASISGLKPNGEHGFHVHEKGDCSAPDAMSAAGHFNPAGKSHGHYGGPERHGGDMPNLKADANGNVEVSFTVDAITLKEGDAANIVGRAVVIHRDPDDYKSQPAGNSGPRIACGLITRS